MVENQSHLGKMGKLACIILLAAVAVERTPESQTGQTGRTSQTGTHLPMCSNILRVIVDAVCVLQDAQRRECTTVLDRASIAARRKMRHENRKIKKNLSCGNN